MTATMTKPDYVTVYLDGDIKRRFKAQCAIEGIEMSPTVAVLIENWLKERDRTNNKSQK